MDYSPQGNTESDTTEATYHAAHILTFSGPKIKQSMVLINMNFLYSVYKTTKGQKYNYRTLVRNIQFTNITIPFTIISAKK